MSDYKSPGDLALVPDGDDAPWPMWRRHLLRLIHGSPLATDEELAMLERAAHLREVK